MKNLINRASIGAKKTNYIFKARWLQGAASANESKKMQVNPRITPVRFAFALALCLTLCVGNAWGASPASSTSFSSLSGNIGSDSNISYSTGNGDATTATAIDGTSIKLYRSTGDNAGGILLITANNGVKITSFTITFTGVLGYRSAANTTTAPKSNYTSLTSGTAVSNLDLSSVQIGNIATTKTQAFVTAVSVSYSTGCSKSVTITKGTESHGSVTTIATSPVATCSATASDRRITVTITPDECYDAPSTLTWTNSSGTVSASKQSGPTDNGDGTFSYVYQFAQNDNGAGTFGVTCTAKAAGKTVNFSAGPGVSASSSLTETCDGSGVTLPNVTASGVCKGWTTFAGWATTAVSDSTTTSGVTLYAAGSKYVPASNGMTLYAVYSKSKSGASTIDTIAPGDFGVSSGTAIGTKTVGTITFKGEQGDNGTATNVPKYYDGPTLRCYASNYLTISSSNTITQIDFTYDGSYSGGTIDLSTGSWAGTPTTDWNQTWTGSATSIKFTIGSSQWRITSVRVTTGGGSTTYYCSDPNCCTALGSINGSVFWTYHLRALTAYKPLICSSVF